LLFLGLLVEFTICNFLLNSNCFFNFCNLPIKIADFVRSLSRFSFFNNSRFWILWIFLLINHFNVLGFFFFVITDSMLWILWPFTSTFVFHFLILLRNQIQNILAFAVIVSNQNLLGKLVLLVFDRLWLCKNFWLGSSLAKKHAFIFKCLHVLLLFVSKVFNFIVFHTEEDSHILNFPFV